MTGRVLAALPLLILVVGCDTEPRSQLVRPNGFAPTMMSRAPVPIQHDPRNEAAEKRVLAIAQKIIDANPQAGMRPLFIVCGVPHPEIFHRGGGTQAWHVYISAGLVGQCKSDAQLAAVLCLELGKIVAEREALASPESRRGELHLPPEETIGRDASGPFGSSDGTRFMEQARLESKRPAPGKAPPLPSPDRLARGYLFKAGYDVRALTEVASLLRQAENHFDLEKQMPPDNRPAPVVPAKPATTAALGRPIPAPPLATPMR